MRRGATLTRESACASFSSAQPDESPSLIENVISRFVRSVGPKRKSHRASFFPSLVMLFVAGRRAPRTNCFRPSVSAGTIPSRRWSGPQWRQGANRGPGEKRESRSLDGGRPGPSGVETHRLHLQTGRAFWGGTAIRISRPHDRMVQPAMADIRRYFDAKFGTGKLVSRARDTDSDVIQTLVGYHWTVGTTMLELFYFSAQHDELVFRTISVDYKAL